MAVGTDQATQRPKVTRAALKAKLFRGLGDPSRLAILETLRDGPRCVSDITGLTGLSQPNVSNHLACLRDCGLVRARPRGRHVYYSLAHPGVAEILARADKLMERVAAGVEACPNYQERT